MKFVFTLMLRDVFQQARAVKLQPILREAGETEGAVVLNSGGRPQREQMMRFPTVALSEMLAGWAEQLGLSSWLTSSYKLKDAYIHLELGKV